MRNGPGERSGKGLSRTAKDRKTPHCPPNGEKKKGRTKAKKKKGIRIGQKKREKRENPANAQKHEWRKAERRGKRRKERSGSSGERVRRKQGGIEKGKPEVILREHSFKIKGREHRTQKLKKGTRGASKFRGGVGPLGKTRWQRRGHTQQPEWGPFDGKKKKKKKTTGTPGQAGARPGKIYPEAKGKKKRH